MVYPQLVFGTSVVIGKRSCICSNFFPFIFSSYFRYTVVAGWSTSKSAVFNQALCWKRRGRRWNHKESGDLSYGCSSFYPRNGEDWSGNPCKSLIKAAKSWPVCNTYPRRESSSEARRHLQWDSYRLSSRTWSSTTDFRSLAKRKLSGRKNPTVIVLDNTENIQGEELMNSLNGSWNLPRMLSW